MAHESAFLHVSASPYPSPQGTQAVLRSMLEALNATDRRHRLFTYAHGDESPTGSFPLHRLEGGPRVASLRSGPSLGKALLDLRMVGATRRLARRVGARAIVAHNVEAALVARAARVLPVVYVAHTSFADELPSYSAPRWTGALRAAGSALDRIALGAERVITVAPALTQRLRRWRPDAATLLPPWRLAERSTPAERAQARRRWALPDNARVLLYAGNLDAYQGWEDAIATLTKLARSEPTAHLVVATASRPAPLFDAARMAGVANRLRVVPLSDEGARRMAYAAADVALVPRRVAGGVPIKLLDAFSRGLPVVTTPRALAGLSAEAACLLCPDDDTDAMAGACVRAMRETGLAPRLANTGRLYLETHHSAGVFASSMARLLDSPDAWWTTPR